MVKSNRKPKKTYPDFPLTPHATGQWCKKIKGKVYYFGSDAQIALRKYLDSRDEIQAGRTPKEYNPEGCTLKEAVNAFLTVKQNRVDNGELSPLTFGSYHTVCSKLIDHFGKERSLSSLGPGEFERYRASLTKNLGPTSVGDYIRRSRVLFKFAYDSELIKHPVKYGQSFSEPSKKTVRKDRLEKQRENGLRMFEAAELRILLNESSQPLTAAIYLGINCAFGAMDVATLPISAINLDDGWVIFPRPKTAVERRIPLWQETKAHLKEVIESRPAPEVPGDSDLAFLSSRGTRLVRPVGRSRVDLLSKQFDKLLKRCELKRKGVSFYALRHTFETIAGEGRDQVAVDSIMGHVDPSMAANYRQRINEERLTETTNRVNEWLNLPELRT